MRVSNRSGHSRKRRTTGASLMASGRVPKINRTRGNRLFVAVGDPALGQIVGGKFQRNAIARQNADSIAAELAGQMGQYGAVLVELHAEQAAWEFFNNGASDFNIIFFAHSPPRSDYS